MTIRAGSMLEFEVPGQIPDSGHRYNAYGTKKNFLVWKKAAVWAKMWFFVIFWGFSTFFFKSSKIYLFFTPIWSCYTFLERYLPGDWYKIIENHVKLYFHAQIFEESWKIESFFNYFVRQKFVNQNKNLKKILHFLKEDCLPFPKLYSTHL